MKKATLIFIIAMFIGSIMIVNFFGLNYKIYDKYQYAKKIEIIAVKESDGLKILKVDERQDGTTYIYINFLKNYYEETGKKQNIMFTIKTTPDNTTEKELITSGSSDYSYFEENTLMPVLVYKPSIAERKYEVFNFTFQNKMNKTEAFKKVRVITYIKETKEQMNESPFIK